MPPGPSARGLVFLGLCFGVFTWSTAPVIPGGRLDDSWRAALYVAHQEGVLFGSDVNFTYGPLGFLASPYVFDPALGLLAWVWTSALHLGICIAIALMSARHGSWLTSLGLMLMGAVASVFIGPAEALSCLLAVVLINRVTRNGGSAMQRRDYLAIAIVASVASVGLLVKFNVGLVMLALALAFSATFGSRVRSTLGFAAGVMGSTAALWTIAGQRLGDLVPWYRASIELTLGYSSAMGRPGVEGYPGFDGRQWDLVTLLVACIAALIVFRQIRGAPRAEALAILVAFSVFLFQGFKEGTVRHAPMAFYAATFVVVASLFPWGRVAAPGRVVAMTATAAVLAFALQFNPAGLRPMDRVTSALQQLVTLAQVRDDPIPAAKASLRDGYSVPAGMLERIGGAPVHIAPYDTGVVWAYPGITWSPLPVFQAYAAYTSYLDGLNAAALASADGPSFVLRRPNATIDGRSEWYEAPQSMLALACHFSEVLYDEQWQLLERIADRCSDRTVLRSVRAHLGEAIEIPAPPALGTVVIARIRGLDADPLEGVRTFLTSSSIWTITLEDGTYYRLVPKTVDGPLIVSGATSAIYGGRRGPEATRAFTVTAGDALNVPFADQPDTELVIDFESFTIGG